MPLHDIPMVVEIDPIKFVESLFDNEDYEGVFELIEAMDDEAQDWDFTLDLLLLVIKIITDNKAEVIGDLDDNYHEKLREAIGLLEDVTFAKDRKILMSERKQSARQ